MRVRGRGPGSDLRRGPGQLIVPIMPREVLQQRLRLLREQRGLELGEVATLARVAPGRLREIEEGIDRDDAPMIARRVADALGVSHAWLLGLDDPSGTDRVRVPALRSETLERVIAAGQFSDHAIAVAREYRAATGRDLDEPGWREMLAANEGWARDREVRGELDALVTESSIDLDAQVRAEEALDSG